jgi:hypothetical protein
MAKAKGKAGGEKVKVSFGKRKKGSAQKSFNKHDHKDRKYRTR